MLRKSHSTDWHAQSMVEKQSEASVHSMALQQHFEELKAELADFSSVFSAWLGTRRHALTDDKEAFLRTLAEEQDLIEALKRQLAALVVKRQSVVAALQAEQREYEDVARSNDELEAQRDVLAARLKEIREEVQRLRAQLTEEELVLVQSEEAAATRQRRERLEIALSQEKLGLAVHSIQENVTGFTFRYIDPDDWERAFTVLIDVSTNRYRVKSCEPMVPQLTTLIDELNEDNNFFAFLRKMRDSFVQSVTK